MQVSYHALNREDIVFQVGTHSRVAGINRMTHGRDLSLEHSIHHDKDPEWTLALEKIGCLTASVLNL